MALDPEWFEGEEADDDGVPTNIAHVRCGVAATIRACHDGETESGGPIFDVEVTCPKCGASTWIV
jgi:hypothetical protein